jgi:hypothetical protein
VIHLAWVTPVAVDGGELKSWLPLVGGVGHTPRSTTTSRHETPAVAGSEGEGREGVKGKRSRRRCVLPVIGMFFFILHCFLC